MVEFSLEYLKTQYLHGGMDTNKPDTNKRISEQKTKEKLLFFCRLENYVYLCGV